jgi:uncharacterized protein (UPF0261 family)
MRALPYGFPKIMVSTMASGNVAPWVGTRDITMMYSVTDIMGLNPFMRRVLANAAGAACGMAEVELPDSAAKPLVAVTTVGITTQGAVKAAEVLQAAGYETIVFHAVGTGGRAMEEMMRQRLIGAVLDYSTIEVSNEMFHALLAGGPDRLTTAGALGLPQVLCPGAIEVLVFNEPETVPERYRDRRLVRHSPQITDLRLNRDEMADVGREVGCRIEIVSAMQSSSFRKRAMTATPQRARRSSIRMPTRRLSKRSAPAFPSASPSSSGISISMTRPSLPRRPRR